MSYLTLRNLTLRNLIFRFLGLSVFTLLGAQSALADLMPLNGAAVAPNIAEVTVHEDGVVVKLEVYVGDLEVFRELLPNEFLRSDTSRRLSLDERLEIFSREGLQVIADGTRLTPELLIGEPRTRVDRSTALASAQTALSQLPVPKAPDDNRVFYAELRYPFETRPESLVFVPPAKPNGSPKVSTGFIAFHETVPVIDFRYLSGPETLQLDWVDPWYTRFENKNLKRHHTSALMTFLYVEPREVRHETLIRVRDLQNWMEFDQDVTDMLDPSAQDAIKDAARAFFASANPVNIDGKMVKAASSRAEFLTVSTSGLQIAEEDDKIDLPNAILGVILSFPVPALPQKVTVNWELFNERNASIQATATDPAGPFLNLISPDAPAFRWINYLQSYEEPVVSPVVLPIENTLRVPYLSVGLVLAALLATGLATKRRRTGRFVLLSGAAAGVIAATMTTSDPFIYVPNPFDPLPDSETSSRIFAGILENVNTANLEVVAGRRMEELMTVVTDDTVQTVTQELDRALAIRVAGSGLARVDEVQDVQLQDVRSLENGNGFHALASWTVKASAGHWGHNHKRKVSYRALVELIEEADTWKLAAITVVDIRQMN